jgi:Ca2+-binding RTX toxin-like protein
MDSTKAKADWPKWQVEFDAIMAARANDQNSAYRAAYPTRRPSFNFANLTEVRTVFDVVYGEKEQFVLRRLTTMGAAGAALAKDPAFLASKELVALSSMKYLGFFKDSILKEIAAGNRAEAWFQTRYGFTDNSQYSNGWAKRGYFTGSLFGLYDDPAGSPVTTESAKQIYQMLLAHRETIINKEKAYGISPDRKDSPNAKNPLKSAAGDYESVYAPGGFTAPESLQATLEPAFAALISYVNSQRGANAPVVDRTVITNSVAAYVAGDTAAGYILDARADDARSGNNLSNNLLVGGAHKDFLYGGAGKDYLFGGAGADLLYGGDDADILVGGSTVLGDADLLEGGKGDDILVGSAGDDLYIWNKGDGSDTVKEVRHADGTIHAKIQIGWGDKSVVVGGLFLETGAGTGVFQNPDKTLTLRVDAEWKLTMPDGSVMNLGPAKTGDYGITLRKAQAGGTAGRTDSALEEPVISRATPDAAAVTGGAIIAGDRGFGDGTQHDDNGNPTGQATPGSSDFLTGDKGGEIILGLGGSDILEGNEGDDRLYGSSEIDLDMVIEAGRTGAATGLHGDWLNGGEGDDIVVSGNDDDALYGGLGADTLVGGAGNDLLDGDDDYTATRFDWTVKPSQSGNVFDRNVSPVLSYNVAPIGGGADLMYAGAGNDFASGGDGADIIFGEDGDDVLAGGDHNDNVYGGDGNDKLTGDLGGLTTSYGAAAEPGDDYLDGGAGNDFLQGDGGDDILIGGTGDGELYGDNQLYVSRPGEPIDGDDHLDGGEGNDTLVGQGGSDILFGGAGADHLFGDADDVPLTSQGNDYLNGEEGDDYLRGYGGDDVLLGGDGADSVLGEAGDDLLDGGDGDDNLDAGEGDDGLYGGAGKDTLFAGAGDDVLDGGDGDDQIAGGDGDDLALGGAGDDIIWGDAGNDDLDGGEGNDHLQGADGDDALTGGTGDDILMGEAGDDTLDGGDGDDQLNGGDGDDYLDGGDGFDMLDGGAGNDTLVGDANDILIGGGGNDVYIIRATRAPVDDEETGTAPEAAGARAAGTSGSLEMTIDDMGGGTTIEFEQAQVGSGIVFRNVSGNVTDIVLDYGDRTLVLRRGC